MQKTYTSISYFQQKWIPEPSISQTTNIKTSKNPLLHKWIKTLVMSAINFFGTLEINYILQLRELTVKKYGWTLVRAVKTLFQLALILFPLCNFVEALKTKSTLISVKKSTIAATGRSRTIWHSWKPLLQWAVTMWLIWIFVGKFHSQGLHLFHLTQKLLCTGLYPGHLWKTTDGNIVTACGSLASWG